MKNLSIVLVVMIFSACFISCEKENLQQEQSTNTTLKMQKYFDFDDGECFSAYFSHEDAFLVAEKPYYSDYSSIAYSFIERLGNLNDHSFDEAVHLISNVHEEFNNAYQEFSNNVIADLPHLAGKEDYLYLLIDEIQEVVLYGRIKGYGKFLRKTAKLSEAYDRGHITQEQYCEGYNGWVGWLNNKNGGNVIDPWDC